MTDAAIHRASEDVDGDVRSVTGSLWIATGFQPRDEKAGEARDDNTLFVIARRERSEGRGNPSCLGGCER